MKQDRETMILELLTAEHRLEVSALAGRVGVSQVTMRKDLDDLERRGLVIREHGCALLRSSDDVQSRIAYHYEAKRKIAERAAELVDNGDTIMIESGSCCALLADVLVQRRKEEPIEEIVLIGLCTDICVISNALVLKAFLPEVTITVDAACCAGVNPDSHRNALDAMRMCQIGVVNG